VAFTLVVLALAIAVGYARGGRLHRIADASLGWSWLLFLGFGLQIVVQVADPRVELVRGTVGTGLLITSHLLVLGWILANWHRPGILLVFLGLALNATVIAANGGMPVDPEAIEAAGLPMTGELLYGKHILMTESTRLAYLGDVFPIPVLRTVISVGDIVLAAGLIPLVGHLMTYRTPEERRGGRRSRAEARAA
jgi:hypothetical protein